MKILRVMCLVLLLPAAESLAGVTVTIEQSGADVVAEATGSIAMPACISTVPAGSIPGTMDFATGSNFAYIVGQGAADLCSFNLTTAEPLHSAVFTAFADSNSGGPVGVDVAGGEVLVVPQNYISGTAITATSTWANQTLVDLELTPGSYVFDFGTDTITFVVGGGAEAAAVPIDTPVALVLFVLGLMVVGYRLARTA
jgi:hypothetical protein